MNENECSPCLNLPFPFPFFTPINTFPAPQFNSILFLSLSRPFPLYNCRLAARVHHTPSHRRRFPLFAGSPPRPYRRTPSPLHSSCHKFFNIKGMNHWNGPKLELKLNLSPPRAARQVESPSRSAATSPTSSCLSSELNQDESLGYCESPEVTSMMLVGCPRCLMYVMLAEGDPRCPKCKSAVLLDIVRHNAATTPPPVAARRVDKAS